MQRLTKIESNLRELRVKYVTSTGETHETQEDDSDMDIAVEDLHLTEDHEHEEFVYKLPTGRALNSNMTQFKTTGFLAK